MGSMSMRFVGHISSKGASRIRDPMLGFFGFWFLAFLSHPFLRGHLPLSLSLSLSLYSLIVLASKCRMALP